MPNPVSPLTPSDAARDRIYQKVEADLSPPRLVVYGKVGISVLVGGLMSLFFCGQSGIGLGALARDVNGWIMDHVGGAGCVAFCGAIFAILPAILLRIMSSPLQYRAIMRRDHVALPLWIGVFGVVMRQTDHTDNPLWGVLVWIAAGCVAFKVTALLVDRTVVFLSRPKLLEQA